MTIGSEPARRLPARTLVIWRIHSAVGCTVTFAIAGLAGWRWRDIAWVPAAVWLLAGLALAATVTDLLWVLPRRLAAYRFEVTATGIRIRQGVLFSRRLLVPLDQVLYAEVKQGPCYRLLGLAKVQVGTLGSVHDLGPLTTSSANAIVDREIQDWGDCEAV